MSLILAFFGSRRSEEEVMSWEAFQVASSSLEERVQGLVDRLDDLKRDRTKALSLCDTLQLRVMKLENRAKKSFELKSHTHSCSGVTEALHLRIKQARDELVRPSRKERIVEDITAVGETIFVSALFALAMNAVESVMGVFRSADQLPTEAEVAEEMHEGYEGSGIETAGKGEMVLCTYSQGDYITQKQNVQSALADYLKAKKAYDTAVSSSKRVAKELLRESTIPPSVKGRYIENLTKAKLHETSCATKMNTALSKYSQAKIKLSAIERSLGLISTREKSRV